MKITIEPTDQFFMAGDVMVRMWQGTTEARVPVVAFVSLVTFPDQAEVVSEQLVSIPPPDDAAAERWAKTILSGIGRE